MNIFGMPVYVYFVITANAAILLISDWLLVWEREKSVEARRRLIISSLTFCLGCSLLTYKGFAVLYLALIIIERFVSYFLRRYWMWATDALVIVKADLGPMYLMAGTLVSLSPRKVANILHAPLLLWPVFWSEIQLFAVQWVFYNLFRFIWAQP